MTKILSVNEVSMQTVLALTRNGDEIVPEENGKPIVKIIPIAEAEFSVQKPRVAGLGKGSMWMSEDFDNELSDKFWGFDQEL